MVDPTWHYIGHFAGGTIRVYMILMSKKYKIYLDMYRIYQNKSQRHKQIPGGNPGRPGPARRRQSRPAGPARAGRPGPCLRARPGRPEPPIGIC